MDEIYTVKKKNLRIDSASTIMHTMRKILFIAAFLVLVSTGGTLAALDFDVSPNDNGSLDVYLSLDWNYSDHFYSAIIGEYKNVLDSSEDDASYVSTNGKVLSLGADVIGIIFEAGSFDFKVAANVKWDNMNLREIGYVDQSETRFFILNDRTLNLILPRVNGEMGFTHQFLNIAVGGEYSPWLWVDLSQELTISPGLPKTEYSSGQSATHAFSVNGRIRFSNPIITPVVRAEYDHLGIVYDVYTAGGEQQIDVLMQTLNGLVTFVFNIIDLKGLHPTVSVGYSWDWSTDRSAAGAVPVLDKAFSYRFGFEF